MFSRAIVFRCARTMRSTMNAPIVGGVVAAVLEIVQRRGADRQPRLVAVVPLGDLRVQIPAVVVEARRVGDCANLVERAVLDLAEADDDVGDLDAGVVDVVLHFDRRAAEAQHADERVAERGIAQVADVRGLVRIDRRVLDDRLAPGASRRRSSQPRPRSANRASRNARPIEIQIQVAVRRGDDRATPGSAPSAPRVPARWRAALFAACARAGTRR